jgi:putative oxidoreductase
LHGFGGLTTWWDNFAKTGYPSITPWYGLSAEFVGALLLIPGIWTRWAALYTLPLIAGAAHFWAIRNRVTPFGSYETFEYPLLWNFDFRVDTSDGRSPPKVEVRFVPILLQKSVETIGEA